MNKQIKKYRISGKTASHKNSLIKSLIMELVRSEKIKTTPIKAKIMKSKFDRLVTIAKKGDSGKPIINGFFAQNDKAINKFYSLVETKLNDRNSGYTRVIRTLPRKGDNSEQAYIMLVNMEAKEKKSEVQKLLEKQQEAKDKKSVGGRLKKAVAGKSK